jgi:hypothetical protein
VRSLPVLSLSVWLAACGSGGSRPAATTADTAVSVPPRESLAVAGPGVEIWFTLARRGALPDGKPCVDRGIELRRGGKRIPVPLLYTEEAPRIVNDSTARAILYTGCVPGDAYLVDLRSGRPTREKK